MRSYVYVGAVVLAGVFYFVIDPAYHLLPRCPFYTITHLYCPGCGSQRGLHAMLHGEIGSAFAYNPLMMISVVYFLAEAVISLLRKQGRNIVPLLRRRWTPYIVCIVIVLFWILRNIPALPFTLLAPHG